MSWWDASGISSLASQALKNAQKKIDKVLDIEERSSTQAQKKKETKDDVSTERAGGDAAKEGDLWSNWMGSGDQKTKEDSQNDKYHSSWSLPWSLASSSATATSATAKSATAASDNSKAEPDGTETNTNINDSRSLEDRVTDFHLDKYSVKNNDSPATTPVVDSTFMEATDVDESDSFTSDWRDFPMEDIVATSPASVDKLLNEASESGNMSTDLETPYLVDDCEVKAPRNDSHIYSDSGQNLPELSQESSTYLSESHQGSVLLQDDYTGQSKNLSTSVNYAADNLHTETHQNDTAINHPNEPESNPLPTSPCAIMALESEMEPQKALLEVESASHAALEIFVEEESVFSQPSIPAEDNLTPDTSNCEHVSELFSVQENNFQSVLSSSAQRLSQSDSMLEYVNISVSENVSNEGSAVSYDDILHVSSDMGNSRASSDFELPGGHTSSTGSSETGRFDSSIETVVEQDAHSRSDPPYSLFGCEPGDSCISEAKVLDEDPRSLNSSYVKCMLEEAMEDLSKTEDSGSDNHSNGEKSESSKVDSELEKSVYSGHESSDDFETTTSSDIEILSAPHSNGDKYNAPYDLSPLKIALQRSVRDQCRSDSQSSSSANSKGDLDRLSPERGESTTWRDDDLHHDLQSIRETNNPYHPERLLKLAQSVVRQKVHGGQKLAEMAEVLQARETKLIQLSKDNHQLMEDKNILQNQLVQLEEAREADSADLTALTNEFTARLGEAEKKWQAVLKEKESLKQKLTTAEKELERRSGGTDSEALLEEKKEQVAQLLAEGEKLSKQQLQNSNIIKKLRAKEKETDATITSQRKKLDEVTKEMERLTSVLDSREDLEKKQADAINQLNSAVQRQEKEISKLKSDLEDAQEKNRGLQAALDNSYKEIAELHRSNATQDSKAQEAALSAETHVREELKAAMDREQIKFRQEREAFIIQADDLRLEMSRLEKEHSRREDLLRQEIAHLQERLQEDEVRSQDLTHSVTSATRPLLRQIENLQATFGAQSAAWERVEKTLTDRLAESQTALAIAQEKERTACEQLMELTAKLTSVEASNSRLKQEKYQLAAQLDNDKAQLEELQDARNNIVAQFEAGKQKISQELNQLKMDKIHLESQLTVEHTRLETEKKKIIALEEQLKLLQERLRSAESPSPTSSLSLSRNNSMIGSIHEPPSMHWSFHEDSDSGSTLGGSKTSVYDSLRQSGAAIVVENLSSQLKLKEGEITQLQSEIGQLERTRESMARELVNLSNQIDELSGLKTAHQELQEQFNELNSRYSAILQMYGEKEEQVQELRLDLQDVKEMYKSQIDALMAK
ncbi:unnamed protein product [Lymnaea stagnalis]|uniref:TATA element modulatory factor 1 TATA binding domain-containing protein n=1 Tax=Lymnaea stagnalis TaxID=6523 RepID=A0AAV2I1X4_LYMST